MELILQLLPFIALRPSEAVGIKKTPPPDDRFVLYGNNHFLSISVIVVNLTRFVVQNSWWRHKMKAENRNDRRHSRPAISGTESRPTLEISINLITICKSQVVFVTQKEHLFNYDYQLAFTSRRKGKDSSLRKRNFVRSKNEILSDR